METIPSTWDDMRDGAFFRLVAGLFCESFLYGASVLLAANDADESRDDLVPVRCSSRA